MFEATSVALCVSSLKGKLGTKEVAVGKQVTAQVVEIGDALRSGEE